MLGRTHVLIAWASWAAVWWWPTDFGLTAPVIGDEELPGVVVTVAIVAVGAVLPDLGRPRGLAAQFRVGFVRPFALPAHLVHAEFGHRGALHSLTATALVLLGAEYLAGQVGLPGAGAALAWRYVAHLVADMLTRQGIPLFWPLTSAKFGVPRPLDVRTGGLGETLYLAIVAAAAAAYAVGRQVP